jgi:hypothetical protein
MAERGLAKSCLPHRHHTDADANCQHSRNEIHKDVEVSTAPSWLTSVRFVLPGAPELPQRKMPL